MSKLTDSLRERGIVNSFGFCKAGKGKIYIWYRPYENRACIVSAWVVSGIGFKTHPNAAWYDYGDKTFTPFHQTRPEALAEAQRWASEKYGIQDWARDPFGGYQDLRVYIQVIGKPPKKISKKE